MLLQCQHISFPCQFLCMHTCRKADLDRRPTPPMLLFPWCDLHMMCVDSALVCITCVLHVCVGVGCFLQQPCRQHLFLLSCLSWLLLQVFCTAPPCAVCAGLPLRSWLHASCWPLWSLSTVARVGQAARGHGGGKADSAQLCKDVCWMCDFIAWL